MRHSVTTKRAPIWNYEPPPPSECSEWDDVDRAGHFIANPEQFFDKLPKPFRFIDKLLTGLIEKAWEMLEKNDNDRQQRANMPIVAEFEFKSDVGVETVNDGEASLCLPMGNLVAVHHSSCLIIAAAHEQEVCARVEFTVPRRPRWLGHTVLGNGLTMIYSVVGDSGIIHTYAVMGNGRELLALEVNGLFEIDGDVTAVMINANENIVAVSWFDQGCHNMRLLKIPMDAWRNELSLPACTSRSSLSKDAEEAPHIPSPASAHPLAGPSVELAKPTIILSIQGPTFFVPCSAVNLWAAMKHIDIGESAPAGSHANHIATHQFYQKTNTSLVSSSQTKEVHGVSASHVHILKDFSGREASSLLVAVHWPRGSQLFVYPLTQAPSDSGSAPKPIAILHNASPIRTTTICRCTRIVGMVLENDTVALWDQLGELPSLTVDAGAVQSVVVAGCGDGEQRATHHLALVSRQQEIALYTIANTAAAHLSDPCSITRSVIGSANDQAATRLFSFARWPTVLLASINDTRLIAIDLSRRSVIVESALPSDLVLLPPSHGECLAALESDEAKLLLLAHGGDGRITPKDTPCPPQELRCVVVSAGRLISCCEQGEAASSCQREASNALPDWNCHVKTRMVFLANRMLISS